MLLREKVLLIVNPAAGKMQAKSAMLDVLSKLNELGAEVTVLTTESRGQATEYAREYASRFSRIICCGGDGTLNEVVNGLLETDASVRLGYIPAGSTNDFASGLGLSKDLVKSAEAAYSGNVRKLDIGSFNGRKFVYVASFGLFSAASYSASQSIKNILGHTAYVLKGAEELARIQEYTVKVNVDGETIEGPFIHGSICNAMSIGGILKVDPSMVDLSDGKFEIMLVKPLKKPDSLARLINVVRTHKPDPEVMEFRHGSHITVEFEEPQPWSLDGEREEGTRLVEIQNLHQAIDLVC